MIAKPKPLKPRRQVVRDIFESSSGYCLLNFPAAKALRQEPIWLLASLLMSPYGLLAYRLRFLQQLFCERGVSLMSELGKSLRLLAQQHEPLTPQWAF